MGGLFAGIEVLKGNLGAALFATTMIPAGIIWGYAVHRFGMARSLPRFLVPSALVGLTTTLLAVPITVLYLGGRAGRGADPLFAMLEEVSGVWAAVGIVNTALSLPDKLLTGALAYGVARLVLRAYPPTANAAPLTSPAR